VRISIVYRNEPVWI